ncbi:MAG: thioredoxin-disulfide reductase [Candidatus Omnitrophota bacterium]
MHELVIIGAGPAGLTAALYAGRFRLKTAILEKMTAGGQIMLSVAIENYPGFPGGISTFELIDRFKKQVEDLGIEIENKDVIGLSQALDSGSLFYEIKTQDQTLKTKAVIIATGASPKRLGVPGEEKLTGRGVSYCGTCDGPLFKDKDIVVVGGGDRALEEAIFLSGYAKKVNLIHRRSALRASKIVEEKARSNPKINFILETVVEEIKGDNKVEAVKIRNVKTNLLDEIPCQGGFIFVGINPNTGFLKNLLEIDEGGFIITDQEMQASKPGVFACGDCRKKSLWQVVNACGEGATASASAQRYLL